MPDPTDPAAPAADASEIPGFAERRAQFLRDRGLPTPPIDEDDAGSAPPEEVEAPAVALARQRREMMQAYRQRLDALRPPAPPDGGGAP